jgi:hypothetical protein
MSFKKAKSSKLHQRSEAVFNCSHVIDFGCSHIKKRFLSLFLEKPWAFLYFTWGQWPYSIVGFQSPKLHR